MSQVIWVIQANMAQTNPAANDYVLGQAGAQATASANATTIVTNAITALSLGTASTHATADFATPASVSAKFTQPVGTTLQFLRGDGSLATFPVLSTVATSGAYTDLSGKPTLGTAAALSSGTFATAAQGTLAASALQSFTETDPVASPALTTHGALTTTAHGGIVASTDSRLTNARAPTTHASTHAPGGSDPVAGLMVADTGWTAATATGSKTITLSTWTAGGITSAIITGANALVGVSGLGTVLGSMDTQLAALTARLSQLEATLSVGKLPNL